MSPAASDIFSYPVDDESDIVFSDPLQPFVVKPIIEDLLRTRYCVPRSVFLVEGVDYLNPIRRRYRSVRLLVSDGIFCVQAILKGEAHGLVDNGQIYAGCYVRVQSFELRFLDVFDNLKDQVPEEQGGWSGLAGKKRKRGDRLRKMAYLLLENPTTVGWNSAYMKMLNCRKQASQPEVAVLAEESETSAVPERDVAAARADKAPLPAATDKETLSGPASKLQSCPEQGSIADPAVSHLGHLNLTKGQPSSITAQSSSEPLPWSTDDPTKPVKLTALRLVPNLPYKQNWMVNVLAVVSSISDVEPSHLPPYHQRTARLTDPSTSKQVLLTVFLDPDDFNPALGSVVLLLGVKNHRFDGGSLKKYASDRPKNGTSWWFEEPKDLGWCDVDGLKAWWDSKQQNA